MFLSLNFFSYSARDSRYSGVPLLCRFLGDKIFENRHKTGNFRVSSDDNAKKPYFALGEILKSSAMLFRSFSTSRRSNFRSFLLDLEYCGD